MMICRLSYLYQYLICTINVNAINTAVTLTPEYLRMYGVVVSTRKLEKGVKRVALLYTAARMYVYIYVHTAVAPLC